MGEKRWLGCYAACTLAEKNWRSQHTVALSSREQPINVHSKLEKIWASFLALEDSG